MNPANSFLSYPSFTFLPQNANPNPSFPVPPIPAPPPPSELFVPIPSPNPIPSPSIPPNYTIPSTITAINESIQRAEATLQSISQLLNLPSTNPTANLATCPFNPNHLMPPHSLFLHFLRCRSAPSVISPSLLDSVRYSKSLLDAPNQTLFPKSDTDLCLSLDEYIEFGNSSFFYKDCPGVVGSFDQDAAKRTFTLPVVLSAECANFSGSCSNTKTKKEVPDILILPSEFWAARIEIETWRDFPSSYSYSVLRIIFCLQRMKESAVLEWIILNSPRCGIVIDVSMRDHIFVILKLCLKAIWREAFNSLELVMRGEMGKGEKGIKCLRLVEVLTWLASHLSILYGDANGKHFAIEMVAQCLLSAGSGSLVFKLREEEERDFDVTENSLSECNIFVSQVAAAVAALHERSLLEERIKDLHFGGLRTKTQLINEHSYASMRADKERGKRPNYRPVLEHDGLLWQRSQNQDQNKSKSLEERLAEERDYKRRRMSYRGKKVKRTRTEVMRDLIEEHMEEIKQAGGIGCFVKGAQELGIFLRGSSSSHDMAADADEPKGSGGHVANRSHSDVSNESREDRKRSVGKDKHDRGYRSRSPVRSHSQTHGRHGHQRDLDDMDCARNKYDRNGSFSSRSSKYHDNRYVSSSSNLANDSSMGKYDHMPESKDRHGHRKYWNHKSPEFVSQTTFKDRYDPSGSYDRYDESNDALVDSKYIRPDKLKTLDDVKHHKHQTHGSSRKRHQYDPHGKS